MKHQHMWYAGMLLASLLTMHSLAWADGWEWGEREEHEAYERHENRGYVREPVPVNKAFQNECSACHFAYPASFLPARSWKKIMNNLEHHFGENAELDATTKHEIETYLVKHATNRYLPNIGRFTKDKDIPIRITETSYFRREHGEIPSRMVKGNSKVGSFSNCLACHTGASKGSFSEAGVRIPGYGGWE